ncbi:structural maintenance of chromosomes protein 1A-like [Schistocerca nitens]|uniref:structural maintenance of chromosomes protein 1A-like n=1 Tax=Schistocerca nitens TaxID=7011 RepID=UPI002119494F|nr:structural maintenance of chromosomes protein 1A-like [Schistocerca nitens]
MSKYKALLKNIENDMTYTEQRTVQIKSNIQTSENIITDVRNKLAERQKLMDDLRQKIESIKDHVFQNFLRELGSPSIYVFEQRDYRIYKEKLTKKLELQEKLEFLKQQKNFELSQSTADKIDLWTKIVREKQDMYEDLQKEEERLSIELAAHNDDTATLDRKIKEAEAREEIISEKIKQIEKRISTRDHEKWMLSTTMEVLETNLKQQHQWHIKYLFESKMKNIDLPFVRGSLADVSLTSSSSDTSAERTVLRSDEIEVDFSDLTEEDKSLSAEDFDSLIVTMESEIQDLESNSLDSPDIAQVTERVNMWEDKMKEINIKLKRETAKANNLRNKFENIKRRRFEAFMACFKHVSSMISNIYKDLMQSDLCHVMLTLENEEEPYLGGVQVCFVEHGKPCIGMASLSGGEAVMAGLALTFALHSFLPSPLLIFDEVDDALDANNIDRLVRYVNSHKDSMQITVITLNKKIAAECDVIVGVCPNHTFKEHLVTKVITLNLSLYPKDGETQLKKLIEKSQAVREKEGQ